MLNEIDGLVSAFERGKLSRRQLIAGLGGCVAALAGVARASGDELPGGGSATFTALELNHIALDVTDVGRSRDWYRKHLKLTVRRESENNCFMGCGDHFVALFRNKEPGLNHYCYSIKNYDAARAVKTLKDAGLKPRRTANRVYFDDPDGITVQVSSKN